jgi:hypothetical protein
MVRMQTKRLQMRPKVQMFSDMAEAEAWPFQANATAAA